MIDRALQQIGCILLLLASAAVTASTPAAPAMPLWQTLEFEQKAFWATARSRIDLTPVAEKPGFWQLEADSSVLDNSERVELLLNANSGKAVQRTRLSAGKDQRIKHYDYGKQSIERVRRNPGTTTNLPPAQWPVTSERSIDYPQDTRDHVITDAYALLVLADRMQADSAAAASVVVHTDFNFYQVRMTRGNGITIPVDYTIDNTRHISGERDTRAVKLEITPLGTLMEKPDFSFMGLHGSITLLYDAVSGQLLQIRGTAPRIGDARIDLKAVTLRG
tara:strand:+ start:43012 stop:43842 length:831 start_codon:yes stop_codon:yes gene_type:complete